MYIFATLYMICRLSIVLIIHAHFEKCDNNCQDPRRTYHFNLDSEKTLVMLNIFEVLLIVLVVLISAQQSFITFKLGQLVYILPYNYKWQQFYALASACIVSTIYYAVTYEIWISLFPIVFEDKWKAILIQCLKFILTASLYSAILVKTLKTIKKISNSKITGWAVLTNLAENR